MSTFNSGSLKDFHALATGGYLRYDQKIGKRFYFGVAGYTSYNLGIQDLTVPDEATGRTSRFESRLYNYGDLSDPLVLLLGEAFAGFKSGGHNVKVGRLKIKSPLLNPQDGWMIPTLTQGVWYSYSQNSLKIQTGVINAIAPTGSDEFFNIGESIGYYPGGRSYLGGPSGYSGNTNSDYVALFNVNHRIHKFDFKIWNYYVDNLFNALYLRPGFQISNDTKLSAEWVNQLKVGDGGNAIDSLRYFESDQSNLVGIQLMQKLGKTRISVSYNHIFKNGRFLFPREWGREVLFSFQKRERSEGAADNHALVLNFHNQIKWSGQSIVLESSIGHHWKPAVVNQSDNKYAQPDYTHINLELAYNNDKFSKLKPELFLVYKMGGDNFPDTPNFILNKVDMFQINFVVNYNF